MSSSSLDATAEVSAKLANMLFSPLEMPCSHILANLFFGFHVGYSSLSELGSDPT